MSDNWLRIFQIFRIFLQNMFVCHTNINMRGYWDNTLYMHILAGVPCKVRPSLKHRRGADICTYKTSPLLRGAKFRTYECPPPGDVLAEQTSPTRINFSPVVVKAAKYYLGRAAARSRQRKHDKRRLTRQSYQASLSRKVYFITGAILYMGALFVCRRGWLLIWGRTTGRTIHRPHGGFCSVL